MTTINAYKTYSFKDKDPAIDKLRTKIADSEMSHAEVSKVSGVSAGTLNNWFNGGTRRPQFATLAAVAGALNHEWVLAPKRKRR